MGQEEEEAAEEGRRKGEGRKKYALATYATRPSDMLGNHRPAVVSTIQFFLQRTQCCLIYYGIHLLLHNA
jgi:hypothetical protein